MFPTGLEGGFGGDTTVEASKKVVGRGRRGEGGGRGDGARR